MQDVITEAGLHDNSPEQWALELDIALQLEQMVTKGPAAHAVPK